MKILLLGNRGQFGTAFEKICRMRGIECIAPSHSELDVTQPQKISRALSKEAPDAVVNSTGIIDIGECESCPLDAYKVNAQASLYLAEATVEKKITLVQTSTHLVFDGKSHQPYTEYDLPSPNTVYAATKLISEHYAITRNPKSYVVRFPTLFGHRRNEKSGFVEKMITKLIAGDPLRIADDRMDCPTWSEDAAREVAEIVVSRANFGLYHVANRGAVSYFDFIATLAKFLNSQSGIEAAKDKEFIARPPKPLRLAISSDKRPALRPWPEALQEYSEVYR